MQIGGLLGVSKAKPCKSLSKKQEDSHFVLLMIDSSSSHLP